jgi:hypothetical protein
MSSGVSGRQRSSVWRRTRKKSSNSRELASVLVVTGVIRYPFSTYLETKSGLMLPNFFALGVNGPVIFAGASMGAEQPGQKIGRSGCQAANQHGLHRAAHRAGAGQAPFDPTKHQ